jgi:hypothetical protein
MNSEKHPQDIAVDKILDDICKAKYGENWANAKEGVQELSPF